MSKQIKAYATFTCPKCSTIQTAKMPTDACQYFYICQKCGERIKPEAGACCVFCSYSNTKCPPKQKEQLIL